MSGQNTRCEGQWVVPLSPIKLDNRGVASGTAGTSAKPQIINTFKLRLLLSKMTSLNVHEQH